MAPTPIKQSSSEGAQLEVFLCHVNVVLHQPWIFLAISFWPLIHLIFSDPFARFISPPTITPKFQYNEHHTTATHYHCQCQQQQDYLTLIHALLAISVPFTLISSYSTSFELKHALALSCATHLFVSPKLVPLALAALKDPQLRARASPVLSPRRLFLLQGHTPVAFTGSGPPNLKKNFGEMLELMGAKVRSGSVQRTEVRAARRETLAYLVFSSGTTGLPKGVYFSFVAKVDLLIMESVLK